MYTLTRSEPTAFRRVFPFAEYVRGPLLRATLWSAVETLSLVVAMAAAAWTIGLLVHRGNLQLTPDEVVLLGELVGADKVPIDAVNGAVPVDTQFVRLSNRGILPDVYRQRDRAVGGLLRALFRQFPSLRSNESALVTLLMVVAAAVIVGRLAASRARTLAIHQIDAICTRTRLAIHQQTQRLGPSDLQGREAGHVLQLFTSDIQKLRDGMLAEFGTLVRDPFCIAVLLAAALAVDLFLTLQCVVPLAICLIVQRRAAETALDGTQLAAAVADRELKLLGEGLVKTRLIRGYGMEKFEQEQFGKYLDRFQQTMAAAVSRKRWLRRVAAVLTIVCLALVAILVASKVLQGQRDLTLSEAALLGLLFAAMYAPLQNLAALHRRLLDPRDAATRIQLYLNRIPEVGQALGAKFLEPLSKKLEFENVVYQTNDHHQLLNGLNAVFQAGKQYALVGTDPLECLAALSLLPRFIEPQSGRVLFDGEDISWVTLESLRAETVMVGSGESFITGSIRENIACGDNRYSLQDVTEAAKISHAHNFIQKLSQGYETIIGEHGESLDIGQSFRLSLARAILRKPALMIVEEPAELDDDTKSLLDDCYQRIAPGRTVIFLPSRLSTLRRCDQVTFLHRGKVHCVGKHAELVESHELYRHWEYLRFNAFRREVDS